MSKIEDVFEGIKGRALTYVKEVLYEDYARDKEDVISDIADALDIDSEELPAISVNIVLTIGSQTVTVSGLEASEPDEDE